MEWHRTRTDEVIWAIIAEEDGRCLGHIGLYKIDQRSRTAELGIMIGDRSAWGHGIGYQASLFALRHAFMQENLNRISLTVIPTNERAIRLYRRLGFIEEGRLRQVLYRDGQYLDLIAMGLLKSEFVDEE